MQKTARAADLSAAVVAAFERAGFEPAHLLQGPIEITDLSWQAPPLEPEAQLGGMPLSVLMDQPVSVDLAALHTFYTDTLYYLRNSPHEVLTREGYKKTSKIMPRSPVGERNLVFPLPEGWPECSATTGQAFALEAAWLCKTSVGEITSFVSDESNYYAVTPLGNIGVVEGKPSVHPDIWDVNCSGMLPSMLSMPRGAPVDACFYGLIDRLRSVLHQQPESFKEFEGVDLALQALRILAADGVCKPLLTCIQAMPVRKFKRKALVGALAEAVGIMEDWQFTDRTKVAMLYEILVPSCMSMTVFCKRVADVRKTLPSVFTPKREQAIMKYLKHCLKEAEYGSR